MFRLPHCESHNYGDLSVHAFIFYFEFRTNSNSCLLLLLVLDKLKELGVTNFEDSKRAYMRMKNPDHLMIWTP